MIRSRAHTVRRQDHPGRCSAPGVTRRGDLRGQRREPVRAGWRRTALTLAGALLAGCGGSGSGGEQADTPGGEGRALYQQHCALCHGADLRGTGLGPSHLSEVYAASHHDDSSFRSAIANGARAHHWGFGDMPPVPGVSEDEATAIIAFIRQQQEDHGLEPYPPR